MQKKTFVQDILLVEITRIFLPRRPDGLLGGLKEFDTNLPCGGGWIPMKPWPSLTFDSRASAKAFAL